MKPSDKVEVMKEKVHAEKGIPVNQQEIKYKSIILKDDRTLSEYNLEMVSTFELTVRTSRENKCIIQ